MAKIALVTDSTGYIPQDLVEKYNITVVPLVLIWGKEIFEDGVTIMPTEFYARLKKATVMPTSSQATVGKFHEVFEKLLSQDYEILAMVISSKLSGTMNSAIQARESLPAGAPIHIVDSNSTAMAMGFQVLSVARAIEQGASMQDCLSLAEKAVQSTGVVFAVDTLEFLHRGGRIGGGSRFLGTALNIKPILELRDGKVESLERVRTRKKSLARLIELVEEKADGKRPLRLATLHANAPEEARELLAQASTQLGASESIFAEVSPVIGTHAGPGVVGLAYMFGM